MQQHITSTMPPESASPPAYGCIAPDAASAYPEHARRRDGAPATVRGRHRHACHHEAGHILARWYFGHSIVRATVLTVEQVRAGVMIETDRGIRFAGEGAVEGYDIAQGVFNSRRIIPALGLSLDDLRRREVDRDIDLIATYAGIYAEATHRRCSILFCALMGGDGDLQRVGGLLDAWGLHGVERAVVDRDAQRRASALVRSPGGSAAIRGLADKLMVHGELDGRDVPAICRAAYAGRQCEFGAWHDRWPPTPAQIRAGHVPGRARDLPAAGVDPRTDETTACGL